MSNDSNKIYKRKLKGVVVSAAADKTVVVRVSRRFKHPIYSKFVTTSKKYHAHDEGNTANKGDVVTIIESRPHSKLKKWELLTK
jgi:small subunit ribosomal protein S17